MKLVQNMDTELRDILFGTKDRPVNISRMAKRTMIKASTLYFAKQHPRSMSAETLIRIMKDQKIDPAALENVVKNCI